MTMSQHWKRCASYLQAPFEAIDLSWYGTLDQTHRALVNVSRSSAHARRLLRNMLPMPDGEYSDAAEVDDVPAWATWTAAAQRHLVFRVGAIACGPALRLAISRHALDAIARAIDADLHREALDARTELVETDLHAALQAAVEADDVTSFIGGVGLRVITSTLPHRHRFLSFKTRCLIPRRAEFDTELKCNVPAAIELLERLSHG